MKQLLTRFCCLLGGLVGISQLASAQITYTPAALTAASYTEDVIAEGTGTVASKTSTPFDTGTPTVIWCLANTSYVNPSGQSPTTALPTSGLLTSAVTTTPGLRFQLAPATGNNSLRLTGTAPGTMTLVTPGPATEVVVLGAEGNSTSTSAGKTFVVTFTDGSSQTFTNILMPDWFDGANPAVTVGSRVSRYDNSIDNAATNPRLYQARLMLSAANYGKLVASVTASRASNAAASVVLNVMGITLGTTCQGVPNAGTAIAVPANICPGQQSALTPSGASGAGGITFQWQVSTNGGTTFTNIAGATSPTYIAMPNVTTTYQIILTCNGQSATSTPVTVTVLPTTAVVSYAAPPASVTFCRSGTQNVVTATPAGGTFSAGAGLSINATTGALNLGASTPGTYTVTYTPPTGGCAGPATTTVTITAPVVPTVTYAAASFCGGSGTAAPTAITPTGGTFSGSTGLVINPTTGSVNLAQTPAGTYTVSYAGPGSCNATTTVPLTVQPAQAISLSYGGTDFCKAGNNPAAVATPAGGTFASTTGLFIDQTTGAINLNSSANGTYTVTYTVAGACGGQATTRLTVKGNATPTYPNVLTPNGDGLNDVLRFYIADVQNYSLQVFSRWGRRVYEGNSSAAGWSAADNSAGTYYYLVEYTDCAGRPQSVRNWIEVVK